MAKQIYYEDVEVGMDLPTMVKHPTTRQLVKWAGASGDYMELHYDKDVALKAGLPGVIVHGQLTSSFLGQLIMDWMGEEGDLRKFECNWKRMHFPGEDIICKGKVADKRVEGNDHLVECELWSENPKGDVCAPHKAVVALPSKG